MLKKTKIPFLLTGFALTFCLSTLFAVSQKSQEDPLESGFKEGTAQAKRESNNPNLSCKVENKLLNKIVATTLKARESWQSIRNEMDEASDSLTDLISVERLSKKDDIRRERKAVLNYMNIINASEERYRKANALASSEIRKAAIAEYGEGNDLNDFMNGFESTASKFFEIIIEYFRLERELYGNAINVLDFLLMDSTVFSLSNDRLTFERNEDVKEFRRLVENFIKVAKTKIDFLERQCSDTSSLFS